MRPRFVSFARALCLIVLLATVAWLTMPAHAQQRGQGGQRGAGPAQPAAPAGAQQPGQGQQGRGGGGGGRGNTPTFPGPPAGMQALPIDMFTSKNFYKDKDLWLDKRYYRCNTPRQITDIWTGGRIKNAQTGTASW